MSPSDELPVGTVTFMFTDIEGSTRLLTLLGAERYDVELRQHRASLRAVFSTHGGVEVQVEGDLFFVAFRDPVEAIRAAAEIQEVLEGTPIRVRVGVHTGHALVSEGGYVGLDVHRAARVADAAHGGQVLVSQTTRELVPDAPLTDLGEHRLRDLPAPERLYQLGGRAFPPLRSLRRADIPAPVTPLFDRQHERDELDDILLTQRSRLVTVTGVGGVGKTRLALEIAQRSAERFDEAAFVRLESIESSDLAEAAVARALDVTDDTVAAIAERIGRASAFVVLDNAEHLVDGLTFISELLAACPNLTVLATSRLPLRLDGEYEYPLDPLDRSDAMALFFARASASNPRFHATEPVLAAICDRLDGLPLAIELGAAQTRALAADELLVRLENRLALLDRGRRDAPARQQTLRGTIDWSYGLLAKDERDLFARLAVFSGGWTLEAAERVCRASVDLLASLVEQSFVRYPEAGRYSMLETVREYARERLLANGAAEDVRAAHMAYFADFADRLRQGLRGSGQRESLRRLDTEVDNLRAALAWSKQHDRAVELRLASALSDYWKLRGLLREGRARLRGVVSRDELDSPDSLRVLYAAGHFEREAGDLANARRYFERGLSVARRERMADDVALFTTALGSIDRAAGDTERAQERFEEALAMQRELGDDVRTAFTLASLAAGAIEHESFDEAVTLLNQSVQLLRDVGDGNSLAIVLAARAYVSSVLGAAADWREPLQIALDSEAWPAAAWALLVAAALAAHDAPDAAARWLAAGEAGYRDFAVSWDATELRVRAQAEALVRAAGGGSALAAERGNPTELGAAVREALDFGHSPE